MRGFTLIELSIVLVIIGLIVGAVLVGQDLIRAATVRAQITQIEKFNTAVNTFRGKYNALPGDMGVAQATSFGFTVGGGCDGTVAQRDNNGLLDTAQNASEMNTSVLAYEEPALFWMDLSSAQLIEGSFSSGRCEPGLPSLAQTPLFMPYAKINGTRSVYVYDYNGENFFGISAITAWTGSGWIESYPSITVTQAYAIDKKVDDGLPTTGDVRPNFVSAFGLCPQSISGDTCTSANTSTAGGDASSCYDTTTNTYSVGVSNGRNVNCALSFRFQ